MDAVFVNKVAESGIITLNLEDHFPKESIVVFDMKDHLFMGLILKEKDFREALKNLDLSVYENKIVALTCSADAVIPMWAYMLVVSALEPVSSAIIFGNKDQAINKIFIKNISLIPIEMYKDKRIVIKGCGDIPVTEEAYIEITKILRPVAKSIMYGEPCSTVPVYKKASVKI
ncbi:MAG: DUF2480 family protein [Ferruginibacter sp.]